MSTKVRQRTTRRITDHNQYSGSPAKSKNDVLVVMAHPRIEDSRVVKKLFQVAHKSANVTAVDLYGKYPRHDIDVTHEQDVLLKHDVLIYLFPVFWYSSPSLLKEWQDLVFEHGFAYGSSGSMLQDKLFLTAVSCGTEEAEYSATGMHGRSLQEYLAPTYQSAAFCGMHVLAPFILYDSNHVATNKTLPQASENWKTLLHGLTHNRLDETEVQSSENLAHNTSSLII